MAEDKGKKNNKDGDEDAVVEPAKKKSKKGLFIGAGLVLVIIAIGVPVAIMMSKPDKEVEAKSAEKVEIDVSKEDTHKLSKEADEEVEEGEEVLGAIAPLDPFIVNLKGGRFIRLQMQLEFVERDVPARLLQRAAIVRDAVITLLTTKSAEDMLEREGKEKLRKELRNLVNEAMKKELVKQVYFTQFVVQ